MKPIYVAFGNKRLEKEFECLKEGKFQDKQLHTSIEKAISGIKKNPVCGTKVSKKLWPRDYVIKYKISNLFKYDLPNGWRLIYTIKEDDVMILNVILDWFNHKAYERKFGY